MNRFSEFNLCYQFILRQKISLTNYLRHILYNIHPVWFLRNALMRVNMYIDSYLLFTEKKFLFSKKVFKLYYLRSLSNLSLRTENRSENLLNDSPLLKKYRPNCETVSLKPVS